MTEDEKRAAWAEAMNGWLNEKGRRSARTREHYETVWHKFSALVPKMPWEVTRSDIVAFAGQLQTEFQAGSVNAYVGAIKSFYRYALDVPEPQLPGEGDALFTRNPARYIDWLDADDVPAAWISKDEVDRTLAAIRPATLVDLRDAALIETLWRTAMRNTAVRSIRLTDFRRQGGDIWLRYRSKGKERRRVFPTTAWDRIGVYLEERGRRADLDRHLTGKKIDGDLYLFINYASNAALWGDPERRMVGRDTLRGITGQRTYEAVGIDYKPHSFRHGRAHYWHLQGVPVEQISAALDHGSIDMTLHYLRSMENKGKHLADL